ncbi:hypothetical protein TNCT6_71240 [Streptomyces sp. 6-11-2]|nr:hypothetical protein TNCT6_71240 [Streptomyces sp. 6-11-2]
MISGRAVVISFIVFPYVVPGHRGAPMVFTGTQSRRLAGSETGWEPCVVSVRGV